MNKAQKFWDKQASRYDNSERQFEPVFKKIIAQTKVYLDAEDRVLDFGCATGTKTIKLANGVRFIQGLDISGEMINEAIKKKNKANIQNVSYLQGTIFSSDLEKASFNKIIAYAIIHLLEDSDKVIGRIHELLKPGGLLISATPCIKDKMDFKNRLQFSAISFFKRLGLFPLHLNKFTTTEVEELFECQNFSIVKAEKIFSGMTINFVVAKKSKQ